VGRQLVSRLNRLLAPPPLRMAQSPGGGEPHPVGASRRTLPRVLPTKSFAVLNGVLIQGSADAVKEYYQLVRFTATATATATTAAAAAATETGERISRAVGRAVGRDGELPLSAAPLDEFPPELRVYQPGARMEWHQDDIIYATPQVEAIYTVLNDGCDGETRWRLADGTVCGEVMEPNSLLLIQAGGPQHSVSEVTRGSRSIIKSVWTSTLERSDQFHRLQRSSAAGASSAVKVGSMRSMSSKPIKVKPKCIHPKRTKPSSFCKDCPRRK